MVDAQVSNRPRVLVLNAQDTVAVALTPLPPGTPVVVARAGGEVRVVAESLIPFGHKIAIAQIASGEPVIKYGEIIGYAITSIESGQHVHVHNVRSDRAGASRG